MSKLKVLLIIFFIYIGVFYAKSAVIDKNEVDSIRISLLTCAPGEPIYTLFGHTAIRYENPTIGTDSAFNYGLFSYNQPNLSWGFSLGDTDYILGIEIYDRFQWEYDYCV